MRSILLVLLSVIMTVAVAVHADSTSNVKVGIKQGGEELYVKTGGSIKVRDSSMMKVHMQLAEIGTVSLAAVAVAPYAGTISAVRCAVPGETLASATGLYVSINGSLVTNASVAVSSTASTNQSYTLTPSAANTLAVNDIIKIESDGLTTSSTAAGCVVTIAP